jgi:hypothetical protein
MYTEQLTEALSIAAHCDPTSLNNTALTSGAVDSSLFHRLLAVVQTGAVAGHGIISHAGQCEDCPDYDADAPRPRLAATR